MLESVASPKAPNVRTVYAKAVTFRHVEDFRMALQRTPFNMSAGESLQRGKRLPTHPDFATVDHVETGGRNYPYVVGKIPHVDDLYILTGVAEKFFHKAPGFGQPVARIELELSPRFHPMGTPEGGFPTEFPLAKLAKVFQAAHKPSKFLPVLDELTGPDYFRLFQGSARLLVRGFDYEDALGDLPELRLAPELYLKAVISVPHPKEGDPKNHSRNLVFLLMPKKTTDPRIPKEVQQSWLRLREQGAVRGYAERVAAQWAR